MSIVKWILLVLKWALIVSFALVCLIASLMAWEFRPVKYDTDDPDYEYLSKAYRRGQIDLSKLSTTHWERVCFFGSYTRPQDHIEEYGGSLTRKQISELNSKDRVFRTGSVEEFEVLVAIIFDDQTVRLIHLERASNVSRINRLDCVEPNQSVWPEEPIY